MSRAPNTKQVEHAQAFLDGLEGRQRGAPSIALMPVEHASEAARTPDARTPDAATEMVAPNLEPPRGTVITREATVLRLEFARVLRVVAHALEVNETRELLAAGDELAKLREQEQRIASSTIGENWRDHREPMQVVQHMGAAMGVLSRAVDTVRRVPL